MTSPTLADRVEALRRLDLDGLRDVWRQRHGSCPSIRSRDLLRRKLAFDLQADVYGGLDPALRQRLRKAAGAAPRKARIQAGATITREWRGERHVVQVKDDTFVHEGSTYRSLSEVARAITGAHWSGPRFFGLTSTGTPK